MWKYYMQDMHTKRIIMETIDDFKVIVREFKSRLEIHLSFADLQRRTYGRGHLAKPRSENRYQCVRHRNYKTYECAKTGLDAIKVKRI
ncbi:hypothetical protein SS1G_00662 [Sclerotinia sclerotiorum 1980 UF-70]|uniref:Uncharacterized protein n=1 Tax=Sclerotinia sclerotiorum (strain ATCC 18683 / 1980 / Ss-1) TaxID=665079 RepID=A7E5T7_SCLS1|nr:hypothetical protein SS1G_00662 [Sclerotinia sclerotiorum 1980 UF-70]EDN91259.1 hypothetical protein SS1G_00662 [Sclerotinia sclerotiorum 1980 UF-70]